MRTALLVLLFASTLLLSIPALADSTSAQPITLTASSGGGVDLGLFDFSAFGEVNAPPHLAFGTAPITVSYLWSQAFVLPASPVGDYFEVTTVNTYSTGGEIIIDGQAYADQGDNLDLTGRLFPDPNLYQERGFLGIPMATRMDLNGPIFVYVYGDFDRTYFPETCCFGSVNAYGFDQFVQIERFHYDGTPDPLPFAPEPGTNTLMLVGGFGIAMIAFRKKTRDDSRGSHPRRAAIR